MMDRIQAQAIVSELLAREGLALDRQDWNAWIALFAEDIEYWVPAWKGEDQLVDDVRREVSLIYHDNRSGLEERILRIRTRKSVTAMPLPRTAHMVGNILIATVEETLIEGTASFIVDEYDPRVSKASRQSGLYEFRLVLTEGVWRYRRKKTVLINDLIPTVVDFYNL